MVHTAVQPDPGLAELLARRARGAGVRRLTLDLTLGVAAAAALAAWRPAAWPALAAAACCFAAFGAWGLADRRAATLEARARDDLRIPRPADAAAPWRAVRGAAAAVGTLAAVALVCATLFGMLGTWIS
jgi:hypothetical protein